MQLRGFTKINLKWLKILANLSFMQQDSNHKNALNELNGEIGDPSA